MTEAEQDIVADIEADAGEESSVRRKKDIVDHVSQATGLKKRDVREALDAAFGYLHSSLLDGKEIAYPTLGKIKVQVQRADSENPKMVYRVALNKNTVHEDDGETALDPAEKDA
ncbi:nucleoid DNA-binding protein [Rubricella aquisinus]|uniref:Nucleoid DNA-binding protein n=1 Tax=Rubricella aquisinus TaxID=2028108 RepID=A0A840WX97_9RHOB|nr:nucleoid DNA-binding protein [Rubricella aquisinus]